jgi:hypothetical protein
MTIKDLIKTTEIKIPGTDIVVIMKEDMTWFEYQESKKISNPDEGGIFALSKLIESWNIKKEDGSIEEITVETLKKMPREIISPLVEKAVELTGEKIQKKKP